MYTAIVRSMTTYYESQSLTGVMKTYSTAATEVLLYDILVESIATRSTRRIVRA